MEQNLNIAEILKNKPIDLKLYSSTFGYIKFIGVHKDKIYFSSEDTNVHLVKPNGKMYDDVLGTVYCQDTKEPIWIVAMKEVLGGKLIEFQSFTRINLKLKNEALLRN